MPIIFRGIHKCEYCKKEYEWVNFELIRNKLSSRHFIVESIPSEPKARYVELIENGKYRVEINCPHCGKCNLFEHQEEN